MMTGVHMVAVVHIFNFTVIFILLAILLFILLAVFIMGFYFSGLLLHPRTLSSRETLRRDRIAGKIKDQYERLNWEEVYITSTFGYRLHGVLFPLKNSKKAVVICHGITWTLHGSVKYVDMFLKLGFNVLLCDHRNHGKSGGSNTTYGYYEKYDVMAWIDWLHIKFGSECLIGVMGESLGAAVAMQAAAIDGRIAFCIADCPFSDLEELLRYHLEKFTHLPAGPLLKLTEIFAMVRSGFRYEKSSVRKVVNMIKAPVMLIHGKNDGYIPREMSIDLYNKLNCNKKLYIAPRSGHVEAYWKNKDEYESLVTEFLTESCIVIPLPEAVGE